MTFNNEYPVRQGDGDPGRRPPRQTVRTWLIVGTVFVLLAGIAAYAAYRALRTTVVPFTAVAGCQAGTGPDAVPLATDQAAIAATIAGVAVRYGLPARALTIAYATGLQESKLENLSYGDRDSVGVFQQRPSEGWGTSAQLQDPVYATTKFFSALVQVPGYLKLPINVAAQDVQHSADGSAYLNYVDEAGTLTSAFATSRAVTCWKGTGDPTVRLDLHGAAIQLDATFGVPGQRSVLTSITRIRSGKADLIQAASAAGWTVADWLVTEAASYGITHVSYAGYIWTEGTGSTAWHRDPGPSVGGIVAS
jgi:phage shock protein PspC (stress-responsive transcriptional regulator)